MRRVHFHARDSKTENTDWHSLPFYEVEKKLERFNRVLEKGYRSRFRIVGDIYGWDVVLDDGGRVALIETVEDAERILREEFGLQP